MLAFDFWLISLIFIKFALYVSSFANVGFVLFSNIMWVQNSKLLAWISCWTFRSLLLSLTMTFLQFGFQVGQLAGSGFYGFLEFEIALLLLKGSVGLAFFLKLLAVLLIFVSFHHLFFKKYFAFSGAFIMALSFVAIGHATHAAVLLVPVLGLHILIVCFWFGALGPLYYILSQEDVRDEALRLLESFSEKAFYSVIVLLGLGIVAAFILLGSFEALFFSNYGLVIIGKIAFVIALLLLAFLNKYRFLPEFKKGSERAEISLQKSIVLESCLFIMIFAIVAFLTSAVNLPLNR